jgi:aryl-alcohol dehydrogenase-like predicted oxidoreductase
METRKLGQQGLEVAALGLGCMGMTGIYRTGADAAECEATLIEAVDAGVTLFDTAEIYGPFTNEELLGRVLGGPRRDKLVLATKFGLDLAQAAGSSWELDSRPEHIREVVEQSLRRLRTDRIDLPCQHRVDPKVPIEDVVGTMAQFVRAGKVRYLGLSEASGPGPGTIQRGIIGAITRGCRKAISTPTCGWWKSSRRWRPAPEQLRAKLHSPGCWPRVRT